MAILLAELGARQRGVVTREQLIVRGCRPSTIADWVRARHLHRLHPGVYSVIPPSLLPQEGHWLAAVLACGEGAALSHQPAGQLAWIIDGRESVATHVSVPSRRRIRIPGLIVHRPRLLLPIDITTRRGIPTTTRTRTVWDLAYLLSATQTRRAFEQAEKQHDLDRRRLQELVEAAPSRRGTRTIRRLLATGTVPLERTRTKLEEIVVHVCTDNGIALPAVNVPLLGFEVDFLWERERFVVEADGGDHLNERQRDRDNERDILLARAGYLVRRYTWWAVQDERAIAAEILAILRERTPGKGAADASVPLPGLARPMIDDR